METRNIALTLDKAKEWYNSGNEALKETALQAFTEDELKEFDFRSIKTFIDAIKAFRKDSPSTIMGIYKNLLKVSKASAASFRLNIIRQALNMGQKIDFTEGKIWFPKDLAVLPQNSHCGNSREVETAKVRIGCGTFTLLSGDVLSSTCSGLGDFLPVTGVAYSDAGISFLGCATKEIAEHFGRYFAKEIFEAKYGDLIDYEWV